MSGIQVYRVSGVGSREHKEEVQLYDKEEDIEYDKEDCESNNDIPTFDSVIVLPEDSPTSVRSRGDAPLGVGQSPGQGCLGSPIPHATRAPKTPGKLGRSSAPGTSASPSVLASLTTPAAKHVARSGMKASPSSASIMSVHSVARSVHSLRSAFSNLSRGSGRTKGGEEHRHIDLPKEVIAAVGDLENSDNPKIIARALVVLYQPLKTESSCAALVGAGIDQAILEVLALHYRDPRVAEWGCRLATILATLHSFVQFRMTRESDAVEIFMAVLSHYIQNPADNNQDSILLFALSSLRNLATCKDAQPFFPSHSVSRFALNGVYEGQLALTPAMISQAWGLVCNLPLRGDILGLVREKSGVLGSIGKIMTEHLDHPSVQIAGCRLIAHLGMDAKSLLNGLLKVNIQRVVEGSMEKYPSDPLVTVQGATAISVLSLAKSASKVLVDMCVRVILPRMHSFQSNPAIQGQAMRILRNIADNPKARAVISRERGLSLVLWSMKAHSKNAELQVQGARALSALAVEEEDQKAVGRERGIEVLLAAIRFHCDNPQVIRHCAACIAAMALDIPENQDLVVELDGIRPLVQAIKAFGDDDDLLMLESLRALCNVGIQVRHETVILERKAHLLITAAMTAHNDNRDVFRLACQCVSNLTTLPTHVSLFIQENTVDRILEGIEAHGSSDASVMQQALRALCNLAIGRDNQDLLGEAGVAHVVAQALATYPDNVLVHEYGMWVWVNLAFENKPRKLEIAEREHLAVAVRTITTHILSPQVLRPAVKLLALLAHFDECRAPLLEVNTLTQLLPALNVHCTDPVIVEFGTLTLCYLTFQAEEQKLLGDSKGLDYVASLFSKHMDSPRILEHGSWLLSNLAFDPKVNTHVPESVVLAMVDALTRFRFHSGIQSKGLQALCNITVKPRLNDLVASDQGIKVILGAMTIHTAHSNIQEFGLRTVCNLTVSDMNKQRITEFQGIEIILDAMKRHAAKRHSSQKLTLWSRFKRHVANAKIQEYGCRCLANLGSEPVALQRLWELNAIDQVVVGMRMLTDFQPVQEYGVRALCSIILNSRDEGPGDYKHKVIPAVVSALKLHMNEPTICAFAARTLTHLADSPDNVLAVAQDAGIPALLHAVVQHNTHEDVVLQCCSAVHNILLTTPSLVGNIVAHDGDDIMEAVCEQYPASPAILRAAHAVLLILHPPGQVARIYSEGPGPSQMIHARTESVLRTVSLQEQAKQSQHQVRAQSSGLAS